MQETVTCEKWYDGSYWSAALPHAWRFFQDRTKHGFPHVFESSSGSRLQIGTSRDVEVYGPREPAPEGLSENQVKAYRVAVSSARIDPWWTWRSFPRVLFPLIRHKAITRRDAGDLTGFTYDQRLAPDRKGWAGSFNAGRWQLWIYFAASDTAFAADEQTALLILASVRFHGEMAPPR